MTRTVSAFVLAGALVLLHAQPSRATHQACECSSSVCSAQGFEITFVNFAPDPLNGLNKFTYKVCNDENQNADCVPPKDLSHIDVTLPDIGECVSAGQQVSVQQLGCALGCDPELTCSVNDKDPSCDLCKSGTGVPGVPCQPPDNPTLKVLKCDVKDGQNLDPGECATIEISIAGEVPGLGAGSVDVVTKAGPACTSDSICGPACDCGEELNDQCLTRTAGFWGTHPAITSTFLPVTVCGKVLDTTDVLPTPKCNSVTEALCVSPGLEGNRKMDRKPAREQLARQLAAAKLNINATAANGGSCDAGTVGAILACEQIYCDRSNKQISESGCIELIDQFNNSLDTFSVTPSPFDSPGPADPTKCQQANGNGVIILSCP